MTAVHLSALCYGVCWWLFVAIHAAHVSVIYWIFMSLLHVVNRPLTITRLLQTRGIAYEPTFFLIQAGISLLLLFIHSLEIGRLVVGSLRARRLTLVNYSLLLEPKLQSGPSTIYQRVIHRLRRLRWLCSTRSPYFQQIYHIKEVGEIVLQTTQAFRVSFLISHPWTNQALVAVICINAWSSPLLYRVFRHSFAKRRVSCLVVDVVLDFTTTMMVPMALYTTYTKLLVKRFLFDPVWTLQATNDLVQFTSNSVFEICFRFTASVSMLLSLRTLQALVRRADTKIDICHSAPGPVTAVALAGSVVSTATVAKSSSQSFARKRWITVTHALFVIYGLAIATIHTIASSGVTAHVETGCALTMRQWFTTKSACAVLEINCHARQIDGAADELALALSRVDCLALSAITISHCSDVHVPKAILGFPNLVWFEIYNSTLASWPASATPTQATSPKLSRMLFIRVNISGSTLPQGLLPANTRVFPSSLTELVFVKTSLVTWPSDLARRWSPQSVQAFVLEDCGLSSVPPQLEAFRLTRLSLAANAIQELPAWLFDGTKSFTVFSVAGNPLNELPFGVSRVASGVFQRLVGKTTSVNGVFLQNTNISTLPDWATQAGLCSTVRLHISGSPVCTKAHDLLSRCEPDATHCDVPPEMDPELSTGRLFPLEDHDAQHPFESTPVLLGTE